MSDIIIMLCSFLNEILTNEFVLSTSFCRAVLVTEYFFLEEEWVTGADHLSVQKVAWVQGTKHISLPSSW